MVLELRTGSHETRHDREQQGGLTLEQFSNALRREPFKLDRASMSDEQVAALFASLDTAKSGVVALPKLGSLAGSATRRPLGAPCSGGLTSLIVFATLDVDMGDLFPHPHARPAVLQLDSTMPS